MDQKIKKVLIDAGVAKGISSNEVLILLVLGNNEMFHAFSENIKKTLPQEEYEEVMTFFQLQRKTVQEAQKKYESDLNAAISQSEKDYFEQEIKKLTPAENKNIQQEIDFLFSQT